MITLTNRIIPTALMVIAFLLCQAPYSQGENRDGSPGIIRLGFSAKFLNDVSRVDAQVALELWIREFSKNGRIKAEPKPFIYENAQEMEKSLRNREVDLIALSTLNYLSLRETVQLEPALVGNRGKKDVGGDEIVIVVRRDKGITDLSQLKGRKLIMHSGILLDSANLWLHNVLTQKKLPEKERFFGSIQEVKKVSQSVLPVFFNQADAGLIARASFETMIELNPQIGTDMVVLLSSEKLLYGIFCVRKGLSADIRTEIINNALNIQKTPTGRQILTLFQIESITPYKPSYLATTLSLLGDQNLKGRVLGRKTE